MGSAAARDSLAGIEASIAEVAAAVIERARRECPDVQWTAIVRGRDARWLAAALEGMKVVDDKPPGGKVAFVRSLRAARFDAGYTVEHMVRGLDAVYEEVL